MTTNMLVTGGAGFIGSNFVRRMIRRPDIRVVNFDALTYSGVESTISDLDTHPRYTFVKGDIRHREAVKSALTDIDVVVHFAAESHVDRSITGPVVFSETNMVGTAVLLEEARRSDVQRFVHISTDEVYGSIATGSADERAPLDPSSPYSASKAGSDLLALSYFKTFGMPVVVTRCTNNFGPYQFPEKAIPRFITNVLDGRKIPVYGDGLNERDWLHVEDHCSAVELLVESGVPGEIYNIGADSQVSNIDLVNRLLDILGEDESIIEFVPDRPGHDRRYAVDSSKLRALGWRPEGSLATRLRDTVTWYRDNEAWWRPLLSRRE